MSQKEDFDLVTKSAMHAHLQRFGQMLAVLMVPVENRKQEEANCFTVTMQEHVFQEYYKQTGKNLEGMLCRHEVAVDFGKHCVCTLKFQVGDVFMITPTTHGFNRRFYPDDAFKLERRD
jgi:hypothetical protein